MAERRELLLDADDMRGNFSRACNQIETEHGKNAAAVFAFEYGRVIADGTRTPEYVFEQAADKVGYVIDWHGVKDD